MIKMTKTNKKQKYLRQPGRDKEAVPDSEAPFVVVDECKNKE